MSYICNLDKENIIQKNSLKLIDENGHEITDKFQILNEQRIFYEYLYSSGHPFIHHEHGEFFVGTINVKE